jgi:hypothetical protein
MDGKHCGCLAQGKKFSRHLIEDILEEDRPLDLSWGEGGKEEEDRGMKKKLRTTFSGWQIFELERIFEGRKYIICAERKQISNHLSVTEQLVKIWFQNKRTKWKKVEKITNQEAGKIMKKKPYGDLLRSTCNS